ncbi:MAG: T9SS type A sorting domain-containing protein [Ferruginibacter sp.]
MKSIILTFSLLFFGLTVFSQATYYWVGGAGPAIIHGVSANWNTQLNGLGTARSTPLATDILIFDGTNIGGTSAATGTVNATATSTNFGQLILQNNAIVILQRVTASTGTITINGGSGDDLVIASGSSLTMTASVAGAGYNITLPTGTTGSIAGILRIQDANIFTVRLYVKDANALNFTDGSKCYINNQVASNYPFGQLSTPVATGGINFKSGSELIYQGGVNPYSSSTFIPFYFESGSTFIFEAANVPNMFVSHTLANVKVRNSATVTAENFYNIDTLTTEAGSAFYTRVTGGSPFAGDIINNGTFGAAAGFTTAHFILDGIVPQTIYGTGTFADVGTFSVGTDADVTLNTNILIGGTATSTISGKLNLQTYTLGGTGDFQFRTAATAISNGTLTLGINTIALDPAVFATGINTANVSVGAHVTGTGIPDNSYVIATNSAGSTFTISKPATLTTAALAAAITITNTAATLVTNNTGGADGSITTTGTRTFGPGTNYTFNAATTAPFSSSSSNAPGNVTFNAAATTNKTSLSISGTLTLNTGKLIIRSTDLLRITSGNAIAGGPFSSSKYIISNVVGNNIGKLRIDNLSTVTPTLFPVGSSNYYLPVTLTPALAATDFAVGVFEGVTEDGTPTGTAFYAAKKTDVVDAVWIIDRPTGSGDCIVNLAWDAALEGSNFATFANSKIGISHYDGPLWGVSLGTGDNALNNATALYSTFSPFGVGYNNAILASQLKNISASIKTNGVEINWQVANEAGIQLYEIEKSTNKVDFINIGSVDASNKDRYQFTDATVPAGIVYYRLKIIGLSGDIKYSDIVIVKQHADDKEISLYPNPVVNNITLSGVAGNASYRIINAAGQVVMQQQAIANSFSIDVSALQKGQYFIVIVSPDNTAVKKYFVKQ